MTIPDTTQLVQLLIIVIIAGLFTYVVRLLVGMIPMSAGMAKLADLLVILIGVIIVISKALPVFGVPSPF